MLCILANVSLLLFVANSVTLGWLSNNMSADHEEMHIPVKKVKPKQPKVVTFWFIGVNSATSNESYIFISDQPQQEFGLWWMDNHHMQWMVPLSLYTCTFNKAFFFIFILLFYGPGLLPKSINTNNNTNTYFNLKLLLNCFIFNNTYNTTGQNCLKSKTGTCI